MAAPIQVHYPFGILSDIHGETQLADAIMAAHPEVVQWFNLGDTLDAHRKDNQPALAWLRGSSLPTLKGNHEQMLLTLPDCRWVKGEAGVWVGEGWNPDDHARVLGLPNHLTLVDPTGRTYLLYHSTPHSAWEWVYATISEREFIDTYLDVAAHTRAVIIGHNHTQFQRSFPYEAAELWSCGAVKDGCYLICHAERGQGHILRQPRT